jgi:pheromone a factor receptor
MTIYTLAKRERQFSKIFSSNRNLNRSRYLRLMALSSIEILGTVPIGTYVIVFNARLPMKGWQSWSQTHNNGNFSHVYQIPASYWKNNADFKNSLEMFRWLLVACAIVFFLFFGFADEARQHYRLAFKSLASRVGYSTSSGTLQGSSHAYVVPCAGSDSMGSHHFQ